MEPVGLPFTTNCGSPACAAGTAAVAGKSGRVSAMNSPYSSCWAAALVAESVLLIALPIHGVCALLCARDARFFDLILLWGRTRMPAYLCNFKVWRASSHSPLVLDLPTEDGRRRALQRVLVGHA